MCFGVLLLKLGWCCSHETSQQIVTCSFKNIMPCRKGSELPRLGLAPHKVLKITPWAVDHRYVLKKVGAGADGSSSTHGRIWSD